MTVHPTDPIAALKDKTDDSVYAAAAERAARMLENRRGAAAPGGALEAFGMPPGGPGPGGGIADSAAFEALARPGPITESPLAAAPGQAMLSGALEAIIRAELRPAYFIQNDLIQIEGNYDRIAELEAQKARMEALSKNVGRVDLLNHASAPFIGTGWLIEEDIVVTNRHVAQIMAMPKWPEGWNFADGRFGEPLRVEINTLRQRAAADVRRWPMQVTEILYVASMKEPDIAFVRVKPDPDFTPIPLATGMRKADISIAAVGYPAADAGRNDPELMDDIFGGRYDVKRFAPGRLTGYDETGALLYADYSSLGGNSGSAVLDIATGDAVGLHFAGVFQDTNYAVAADIVAAALRGVRPRIPGTAIPEAETDETPAAKLQGRGGYDPYFLGTGDLAVTLPGLGRWAADVAPVEGGPDGLLRYTHFSTIQSASRRLPLLAAVNIDGAKAFRLKRKGRWSLDGRMGRAHQIGNALYKHNPLDRGHMVRRMDPGWGDTEAEAQQAEIDTFHYTNSCPQHKDLNQRDWVGLEDYILESADTEGFRACVLTGPVFRDTDRRLKEQPGAEDIQIPEAFWKVAAMVNAATGKLSVTAYVLTQGDMIRDLTETAFVLGEYKTYQVKVAALSAMTGLDFSALAAHDPLASASESVFGQAAFEVSGAGSLKLTP